MIERKLTLTTILFILLIAAAVIGGCGQKGGLYLPEKTPAEYAG